MLDLVTITSYLVVVPLLTGLVQYKALSQAGRWLTCLLGVWLVTEICADIVRLQGFSNWNVYALMRFAEIVIVTMFYKKLFINYKACTTIVWFAWTGLAVAIIEYAFMRRPANTFTIFFESVFFIGMGLYACYEMIVMNATRKYLPVNLSLMVFFLGSAIYLASWQFLEHDINLFKLFGDAHAYMLVICYSLFTVLIWRLQV